MADSWVADSGVGATSGGGGWEPDLSGGGGAFANDGFSNGGFSNGDTDFLNGISKDNISKHAGGGGNDGGCRICSADDHFARDCPDKGEQGDFTCYNCGEPGHAKADCVNPAVEREFTGECRTCGTVGHRAAVCPEKGPSVCSLCRIEGHIARECTANRVFATFANSGMEDMSADAAWTALEKADDEKDVDDVRKLILAYAMKLPDLTLVDLEKTFREAEMNTFLIAKEQEVSGTQEIANLQGKLGMKYVVSFQFTNKPRRKALATGWPSTPEENLTRLQEAGYVVDSLNRKCRNCGEFGHIMKDCPQDKNEPEKIQISCQVCNTEGHRARDCTEPRKTARACKNCGETGHMVRDCPTKQPDACRNCLQEGHRAAECENERVMVCKNCDGHGHMAKECPEEKNMSRVQCKNCDEFGHFSRGCPKPTDWTRVECSRCHEKGHTYKRCSQPEAGEDDTGASTGGGGGGDWDNAVPAGGGGGGGDSWDTGAATSNDGDSWGGAAAPSGGSGGW